MMNNNQETSFIICTRDRFEEIVCCIKSILNQTVAPYELIIVDSSEKKGLNEYLMVAFGRFPFQYCYIQTKPGLPYQRNVGIDHAKGRFVTFLDDDIVLDDNFHEEILKTYENKPSAVGVAGIITNDKIFTPVQGFLRRVFLLSTSWGRNNILASGETDFINPDRLEETIKVEILTGGLTCYRRDIFDEFIFDAALTGYALKEDVDFSYRVSRKYDLYITPGAKTTHDPAHISKKDPKTFMYMSMVNSFMFFEKNMTKNVMSVSAFAWSLVGKLLYSFVQAVRYKNGQWIIGSMQGVIAIAKSVIKN